MDDGGIARDIADAAQAWAEVTADALLRDRDHAVSFDPAVPVVRYGWRSVLVPGDERAVFERVSEPETVEFYAVLAGGREVSAQRHWGQMAGRWRP